MLEDLEKTPQTLTDAEKSASTSESQLPVDGSTTATDSQEGGKEAWLTVFGG